MPMIDELDVEIRALITELIDSAPQAPSISELENRDSHSMHSRRTKPRWSGRHSRVLALSGGLGAAAMAALLLVLLLPSVGQKLPVAEAAQLRLIAANAARQPVLQLGPNQWLRTQQVLFVSLTATGQVPITGPGGVAEVTSAPIPNATATAKVVSTQWFNNFGQACATESFGPLQFASKSNLDAWRSAGLTNQPTGMPIASCPNFPAANTLNGFAQGIGAVDVSSLTSDPAVLATELSNGTTGIPGLDQSAPSGNQGFEEAVKLLVGPITGKAASFSAEIYQALALMPGIHKLGEVTTQTGAKGLGYSADTSQDQSTIVINPNTGALLEAHHVLFRYSQPVLDSPDVMMAYSASGTNHLQQGFFLNVGVEWTDPIAARTIVDTSALPSDLKPAPPPVAVIVAKAKPSVGGLVNVPGPPTLNDPLNTLVRQLDAQLGDPGAGFGLDPTPGAEALTLDFNGSRAQVENWAQALRNSDLIASVEINWGDIPTSTPGV
jgi:hypothetical protein